MTTVSLKKNFESINSALTDTSVEYITFKERVSRLSQVDWYIKADLKNGYRQLPVHPTDWHTQIYSLGPNEFYIDITMPFGKANSSRVFCTWTTTWCKSFKYHFEKHYHISISLSVYMDDFFGGPVRTESLNVDLKNARKILRALKKVGAITNTIMNGDKCEGPARSLDIIGMNFNSRKRSCFLAKSKVTKYFQKLLQLRNLGVATSKKLQKIVGYLVYAAWVMPYGRPFISHISHFINVDKINKKVRLDAAALVACDVWLHLLKENRGLSFKFILGKLPRHQDEFFVDASEHGYGGVCGTSFFKISHRQFLKFLKPSERIIFSDFFIAYRELLAALLAFQAFSKIAQNSFIRINSDNSNVVSWLNKGRCSKKIGFFLLSAIEAFKYKFHLRVKAFYIKSRHNVSADMLSRGGTPRWLRSRGVEVKNNVRKIIRLLDNPLPFWKNDY